MQIKSKMYFEVATGNILLTTPEYETQQDITIATKEQDINFYEQLKVYNSDEIDYIELDFGMLKTLISDSTIKSYAINIETKKLDIVYLTQEEIDTNNAAIQEEINMQNRISAITSYVQASDNSQTITSFEDQIIELEKNKILNGDV